MSEAVNKPVFICGGPKSGTSSLVAMLNSHPEALVFFETDLNAVMPGKYARRILEAFPDSRALMYGHDDEADAYRAFRSYAATKGRHYRVIGDKLPTYDGRFFDRLSGFKVVYTLRQPDEWLAKTCSLYADRQDVRPVMYQYLRGLVLARLHPDCLIVRFETFLADNRAVVDSLFAFVGIEPAAESYRWWETAGQPTDPFKLCQHWWTGHPSSLARPVRSDTRTVRKPHAFWDLSDACFAPYLDMATGLVDARQAAADLARFRTVFDGPAIGYDQVIDTATQVTSAKNRRLRGLFSFGKKRRAS